MTLENLLKQAVSQAASDLHLSSDMPPLMRIDGELIHLNETVLSEKNIQTLLHEVMDEELKQAFKKNMTVDFAFTIDGLGRFRINVFNQMLGISAAIRPLSLKIPKLEQLTLPPIVEKLTRLENGLVLVTGPTGCGKSTTLAAMVNAINERESSHIITIEDPIEYIHESKKSLIQQRELGKTTQSFESALRSALREDPDVIMVGEMRDLETVRLALTAAETGHLVFATLHTPSAAESIHRIVDVFPAGEKSVVRSMLSESLQAIIAQKLLKRRDKGRVALVEVMIANSAIRNLIREDKISQIPSVMQTNAALGMQTFEQHMRVLKDKNIV